MTHKKLSEGILNSLEFQTDQIYDSFKRAAETQIYQDAVWLKGLIDVFEKSLLIATRCSPYQGWSRRSQKAQELDKYILYFTIGSDSSNTLEQITKSREFSKYYPPIRETEHTAETLKQTIDNPNSSYLKIQMISLFLGEAHNFTGIVDNLGYIKEKNRKQE